MKKYFVKEIKNELWLCSKDLQEHSVVEVDGQKATIVHMLSDTHCLIEKENYDIVTAALSDLYIKIGIVSVNAASWVKEGQEYIAEGDDCEVHPIHSHDEDGRMYYTDEDGEMVDEPIYLVKNENGNWY